MSDRRPVVSDLSRREMLGALARWSVPTVLTLVLASRPAEAQLQISCPPCTRKTGGVCRACTMNQMLNCQCEPCLGAPYCANGARAAAVEPGATAPGRGLVSDQGSSPASASAQESWFRLLQQPAPAAGNNPFASGLEGPSPFQASPFGRSPVAGSGGGLFQRLRPDARRPF